MWSAHVHSPAVKKRRKRDVSWKRCSASQYRNDDSNFRRRRFPMLTVWDLQLAELVRLHQSEVHCWILSRQRVSFRGRRCKWEVSLYCVTTLVLQYGRWECMFRRWDKILRFCVNVLIECQWEVPISCWEAGRKTWSQMMGCIMWIPMQPQPVAPAE